MSRWMTKAIDFIAFAALAISGLMIAAGMAQSQGTIPASARKTDRPAVTVAVAPTVTTLSATEPGARTTTLIRIAAAVAD